VQKLEHCAGGAGPAKTKNCADFLAPNCVNYFFVKINHVIWKFSEIPEIQTVIVNSLKIKNCASHFNFKLIHSCFFHLHAVSDVLSDLTSFIWYNCDYSTLFRNFNESFEDFESQIMNKGGKFVQI